MKNYLDNRTPLIYIQTINPLQNILIEGIPDYLHTHKGHKLYERSIQPTNAHSYVPFKKQSIVFLIFFNIDYLME